MPGRTYALLTIGDGLVAQIPALLLSVAVAILVTRVSRPHDMSQQIMSQVLGQPRALGVTAGILTLLGIIPGMPNLVFLAMAAACAAGAYRHRQAPRSAEKACRGRAAQARRRAEPSSASCPGTTSKPVDAVGLEVGYRLIPLVDRAQGGELMGRIKGVRKKLSEELGFLVQPVHIRDNLELGPNSYRITDAGRARGRIRGLPRPRARHQSRPGLGHAARIRDQGSGLRPRRGVDREDRGAIRRRRRAIRWSTRAASSPPI